MGLLTETAKWLFRDSLHPTSRMDWASKWEALTERDRHYWTEKSTKILNTEIVSDGEGRNFISCPECKGTGKLKPITVEQAITRAIKEEV